MNKCIAIIPIRAKDIFLENGQIIHIGKKNILEYTVNTALESKYLEKIIVSSDDERIARQALELGVEAPFIRPPSLGEESVRLPQVINYTLNCLNKDYKIDSEIIVLLEVTHPYRDAKLIDKIIQTLYAEELDSIFTVIEEKGNFWQYDNEGNIKCVYESNPYMIRKHKSPLYKEILGLVCATRRRFISNETLLGNKIGVVPVRDIASQIDLFDDVGKLLIKYFEQHQ